MPEAPSIETLKHDADAVRWWLALVDATDDVFVRVPTAGVTRATSLRDELGLDSIGLISVFYAVIDTFDLDHDEDAATTWRTVGDVLDFALACAEEAA